MFVPSCRRFEILERRRVLVPGKTRSVSPRVSPAPWKNGAYPMAYSFLEKGGETEGNSLQSNIFKHSSFGSLANKNLTMALLVVSTLTNCGMIIHHYKILSISEYANIFQTKTLGDSGSLLSHLKKVSTLQLRKITAGVQPPSQPRGTALSTTTWHVSACLVPR